MVVTVKGRRERFPCIVVDRSERGLRLRGSFQLRRGRAVEVTRTFLAQLSRCANFLMLSPRSIPTDRKSVSSHTFAHFAHSLTTFMPDSLRVVSACRGQSLNCGGCVESSGKNTLDSHCAIRPTVARIYSGALPLSTGQTARTRVNNHSGFSLQLRCMARVSDEKTIADLRGQHIETPAANFCFAKTNRQHSDPGETDIHRGKIPFLVIRLLGRLILLFSASGDPFGNLIRAILLFVTLGSPDAFEYSE